MQQRKHNIYMHLLYVYIMYMDKTRGFDRLSSHKRRGGKSPLRPLGAVKSRYRSILNKYIPNAIGVWCYVHCTYTAEVNII